MKANACLLILCGWLVCTARAVADEPSVVFRSPAKEAAWIGVQIIEAACEGVDPKSVAMVEIYLDGKLIREFSAPPYRLRYDFGSVPQNHKLAAVARAMGRQILASAEIRSAFYDDTTSVEVTQIVVPVAVINENNIYVPDLQADDFILLEGGAPQKITYFSRSGQTDFHLLMLIDISSSMKNKIGKVKETGSAFLKQLLGRNDRVKIIFFNQEIIEDADFSNNITELITSLGTAVPFGSTALYDAVAYGLNLMRGIVGRNIIIIFSDGEDNSSVVDPYTLSKKAERSNVKVYCIGTSNVMQEAAFNDIKYQELLEKIASASGGMTFFISGIGEIERVYSQIRQDIRSEYILQFSPEKRLNRYRPITVKLKKHRGYQIRTIKGYYY